jgi:hypothetical protein
MVLCLGLIIIIFHRHIASPMLIRDTRGNSDRHSEPWLGLHMISKDSPLSYIEDCHLQILNFHLVTRVRLRVKILDSTLRAIGIRGFIKLVWIACSRDPLLYGVNDPGLLGPEHGVRILSITYPLLLRFAYPFWCLSALALYGIHRLISFFFFLYSFN